MPLTGPQARQQLADRRLNPTRQQAATATATAGGTRIHVDLIYDGIAFNAEDLFDALEVRYGAGHVTSDRDVLSQGGYQFRIR